LAINKFSLINFGPHFDECGAMRQSSNIWEQIKIAVTEEVGGILATSLLSFESFVYLFPT
jgi:hypothetical protein